MDELKQVLRLMFFGYALVFYVSAQREEAVLWESDESGEVLWKDSFPAALTSAIFNDQSGTVCSNLGEDDESSYVAAWASNHLDNDWAVYAQKLSVEDSSYEGGNRILNVEDEGTQVRPQIAVLRTQPGFVAVWQTDGEQGGSDYAVKMDIFDDSLDSVFESSDGQQRTQIIVSKESDSELRQLAPSVATVEVTIVVDDQSDQDSGGGDNSQGIEQLVTKVERVMVVWMSESDNNNNEENIYEIKARLVDLNGTFLNESFVVAMTPNKDELDENDEEFLMITPRVTGLDNGLFVVSYVKNSSLDNSGHLEVYGQIFDGLTGELMMDEFLISTVNEDDQHSVDLSPLSNGYFASVWVSKDDSDNDGVFVRVFDQFGHRCGDINSEELRVNTNHTFLQTEPRVIPVASQLSSDEDSRFLWFAVGWSSSSSNNDGSQFGTYAQIIRYRVWMGSSSNTCGNNINYDSRYQAMLVGPEFVVNDDSRQTNERISGGCLLNSQGRFAVTLFGDSFDSSGLGIEAQLFRLDISEFIGDESDPPSSDSSSSESISTTTMSPGDSGEGGTGGSNSGGGSDRSTGTEVGLIVALVILILMVPMMFYILRYVWIWHDQRMDHLVAHKGDAGKQASNNDALLWCLPAFCE